ncbi:oocyte zinc finger protein XlCOF20-like isoform X1 [Gambusia affinis]|uniref:oocyte zinc finger protein XlCOF20-like isoform X1 n=2 Tax=Gambusia affinis TaxID=33528 RepID=UPI001CDC61EB|nr:oocyte zinc finger protein XlCOF20-like isoform X1 [Gambusia affinis]XP_043974725.1 oocyte zinc finger protein XlCOF20-like isoform X1 [Gambusia affinis]
MEHQGKTLRADMNPKVLLHRLDAQQVLLLKEDAPEEHGLGFDLQCPESLPPDMNEDDEVFLLSSHLHQHHIQDRELPGDHCETVESIKNQDHGDYSNSSETELIEEDEADVNNVFRQQLSNYRPKSKCRDNDSKVSHSPISEDKMKFFTSKKTLDSMRKVQVEMKISCDDNGKICNRNPTSKTHARTLGGHKYLCKLCGQTFNNRRNLDAHMRVYTGKKPFSCDICGYKSSVKSNLNVHMRTHTGEKPFSCDLCGYKSSIKGSLNVHMRIHTGEKPFSCDICGYRCRDKSSLNKHMRVYTRDKPFSCDVCFKKFSHKGLLNQHMKIHTLEKPFSCEICGFRCNVKSNLNVHMRIHTGEKPFSCQLCGYKCSVKASLKKHTRIHTGYKPFSCDVCLRSFSQKGHLKRHIKIHTGEKPVI